MEENYKFTQNGDLLGFSYEGEHSFLCLVPNGYFDIVKVMPPITKEITFALRFKPKQESPWGLFSIHDEESKAAAFFGHLKEEESKNLLFIVKSNIGQEIEVKVKDGWVVEMACENTKELEKHFI